MSRHTLRQLHDDGKPTGPNLVSDVAMNENDLLIVREMAEELEQLAADLFEAETESRIDPSDAAHWLFDARIRVRSLVDKAVLLSEATPIPNDEAGDKPRSSPSTPNAP